MMIVRKKNVKIKFWRLMIAVRIKLMERLQLLRKKIFHWTQWIVNRAKTIIHLIPLNTAYHLTVLHQKIPMNISKARRVSIIKASSLIKKSRYYRKKNNSHLIKWRKWQLVNRQIQLNKRLSILKKHSLSHRLMKISKINKKIHNQELFLRCPQILRLLT